MTSLTICADNTVERANSISELVQWEDIDFIRCAYLTVLGRHADPDGLDHYVAQMRNGVAKLTILRQLRRSREAAQHDPGIAGFDRALRRHHRSNLPLLGWLVRPWTKAEADHDRARAQRALARQLARIETRLLIIHADCIDQIQSLAEALPGRPRFGLSALGGASIAQPWSAIAGQR